LKKADQPNRPVISLKATVQRGKSGERQTLRFLIAKGEVLGQPISEDKRSEGTS
jgi:hypothetical protein